MASLGDGWASGSLARFDDTRAAQTLQFYDAADIPRLSEPPPDVSQINFRSDLRGCPAFSPVNLPDNSLAAALWGADV